MKGIILAGGAGTRLYPLTVAASKQLLPVYDKPLIYYPLSVLMSAGIKTILVITTPLDLPCFQRLLGDGRQFGIDISYKTQLKPDGIAQALIIGEEFIDGDCCALILGDNIFYGNGLADRLQIAASNFKRNKSTIFAYPVDEPRRYGVVEFDGHDHAVSLEEKPLNPKSNFGITGLYFFDSKAMEYAKQLKPSSRDELEITDLCGIYLKNCALHVELLGQDIVWLDAGTTDDLLDASNVVRSIWKSAGNRICVPEETAYLNGWISAQELLEAGARYGNSPYGSYLEHKAKRILMRTES